MKQLKWKYCFFSWTLFFSVISTNKKRKFSLTTWSANLLNKDKKLLFKESMEIKYILLVKDNFSVIKKIRKVKKDFWEIINLESFLVNYVFYTIHPDLQPFKLKLKDFFIHLIDKFIDILKNYLSLRKEHFILKQWKKSIFSKILKEMKWKKYVMYWLKSLFKPEIMLLMKVIWVINFTLFWKVF